MSAIPKSFFPFLSELSEFSRNKIRVSTTANDSANPYDVTIIQLPEGKVDLSTFSVGGLVTTTTSAGAANVGSVEQLIDQLYVEIGGISIIPAMTYYNQIWQIHADLQGVWNRKGLRQILNLQKPDATLPAANQVAVPFQLNQFIGFLKDISILLTDRMPPIRIYIKWAAPSVLACNATAATTNYSLSKLYATVDLLGLSPVYDQLISDKLSQGSLQMPFTNFTTVPGGSGALTQSSRWSTSANCVERVFGTFLATTFNTNNAQQDATTYYSPYFTRGSPNLNVNCASRFSINGVQYPNIPMDATRGEILLDTMQAMNEDHDLTTALHPSLTTLANFHSKFFVHAHSFTYDDEDSSHRMCGLSGLGSQLLGTFDTVSTQADANLLPFIFIQHKSVLEVGSSRTVRYIH
jgi:hypothetical protein